MKFIVKHVATIDTKAAQQAKGRGRSFNCPRGADEREAQSQSYILGISVRSPKVLSLDIECSQMKMRKKRVKIRLKEMTRTTKRAVLCQRERKRRRERRRARRRRMMMHS